MSGWSRRHVASLPLLGLAGCAGERARETRSGEGWPAEWNRILIQKAVDAADERFDEKEQMLRAIVGAGYRYHTKLRDTVAHPTRDSLEYALTLLEEGSDERAARARKVLERVVRLQVKDPASQWYGIWGYYLEEPPDKMSPADWNWADFNGSYLLLIELRHGAKLGEVLRNEVKAAIAHAAESIKRRNVSMAYTNIAIKGTFVTMAAAELAQDAALAAYAKERTVRLAKQIDETGSFNEYNSPTYARVSLTSLTRFRMYVKDEDSRARMGRIERRLWEHMAAHWDAARAQFAGPMSRCYANDIGSPLWLEKALNGKLGIANLTNRTGEDAETAIHDYRCPDDLAAKFVEVSSNREHIELFAFRKAGEAQVPVLGTTWFGRDFSIGSANRSDFWNQRRPLLGYYGGKSRPARTVVLRVIKDGYDFSSALLYSVQKAARIAGLVNFQSPGGNRHISLDMIKDGAFDCGRLFLELRVEGLDAGYRVTESIDSVVLNSEGVGLAFRLCGSQFGTHSPRLAVSKSASNVTLTVDFKPEGAPKRVVWQQVRTAWAAFGLELGEGRQLLAAPDIKAVVKDELVEISWGELWLKGSARVRTASEQDGAFDSRIGGKPVPNSRLSDKSLA